MFINEEHKKNKQIKNESIKRTEKESNAHNQEIRDDNASARDEGMGSANAYKTAHDYTPYAKEPPTAHEQMSHPPPVRSVHPSVAQPSSSVNMNWSNFSVYQHLTGVPESMHSNGFGSLNDIFRRSAGNTFLEINEENNNEVGEEEGVGVCNSNQVSINNNNKVSNDNNKVSINNNNNLNGINNNNLNGINTNNKVSINTNLNNNNNLNGINNNNNTINVVNASINEQVIINDDTYENERKVREQKEGGDIKRIKVDDNYGKGSNDNYSNLTIPTTITAPSPTTPVLTTIANAKPFLNNLILDVINQKITKHKAQELLQKNNLTIKEYNSTIKEILRTKMYYQNRMSTAIGGECLRTDEMLDDTFLKDVVHSSTGTCSVGDKECFINTFYQTRKILGKKELLNVFAEKCGEERVSYDAKDVHVLERALHFHLRRVMERISEEGKD
ncbi:hypothetical protein THOM_3173 [Trachipleistophora hominis]|uniref:Uncharacterized protein n=1 Tax=Trachipleistophora hominis TaxID=72359 RepID=L7JRI3_TRAHO|nr:hypothetical protein THOM_3173 [Trachipleistophora hominis]